MNRPVTVFALSTAGLLLAAAPTLAQPAATAATTTGAGGAAPAEPGVAEAGRDLATAVIDQYGLTVTVGGGLETFLGRTARDAAGTAAMWDLRAALGTRQRLGIEIAYHGSAAAIDALSSAENATLLGTTIEGNARLNLAQGTWQPYLLAGLGWRYFSVVGEDFTYGNAGIDDDDSLMVIPLGAGLGYRRGGLHADARVTFRPAVFEDMFLINPADLEQDTFGTMHTFGASAMLGYDF